MIAKYRKEGHPGEWYLTDFTMAQVEERVLNLEAEVDVLRGTWCQNNQKEGRGPCGVCIDCLKGQVKSLRELETQLRGSLRQCVNSEIALRAENEKIVR